MDRHQLGCFAFAAGSGIGVVPMPQMANLFCAARLATECLASAYPVRAHDYDKQGTYQHTMLDAVFSQLHFASKE